MALTTIDDRGLKTPIDLLDSEKIRFGTGNDLEIYHDGSHSYITDSGTGQLRIQSDALSIENAAGNENVAFFSEDGAVTLYHNNVAKLATTSSGVAITGILSSNQTSGQAISIGDDAKITLGTGDDLELYHDGSNSYIADTGTGRLLLKGSGIRLHNAAGDENYIHCDDNGGVELYYDNVLKLNTESSGTRIQGQLVLPNTSGVSLSLKDGGKAVFGNGDDLQIYHSGSHSFISNTTGTLQLENAGNITITKGGTENMARFIPDGAVELYYDNVKTFETTGGGGIIRGTEGGDANLFFYADEGDDNADQWRVQAHSDGSFKVLNYADGANEVNIEAHGAGNVELYYDNSKKFETTSEGVETQGELHFKAPSSATGEQVGRIEWWNENDAGVMAKIGVDRTAGTLAPGDLVFSTSANVDTTANGSDGDITERFRITSAGNAKISASGADAKRELQIDGTNGSSENQGFIIENDGENGRVNLKLGTGGGTPATKLTLLPAGGITFNGDTAAANALDDYEEGTFTPGFGGHSATGTFGYATQIGRYTRVGNRVWFTIVLNADSHSGTTSGNFRITGLPFAVRSESPVACTSFWISGFNASAGQHGIATQLNQSEHIEFYVINAGNGNNYTDVAVSSVNISSAFVKVDGCYEIDGA